jgi:hypothetical protein
LSITSRFRKILARGNRTTPAADRSGLTSAISTV